jgi:hypothetical protein
MNGKFTRPAASREDAHVPLLDADLTDIFCFEYERTISNDYTVHFETRLFQLLKEPGSRPQPKKQVMVRKKLDGTINILRGGKPLKFKELLSKKEANRPASDVA